eukprot:CAMPEP_0170194552 /NCGR_PEP_ID=MMETSP0040_2-20121228/59532_1 /TAXON_ID=641309 /ORGANISM="Lotharella oceanica, Strain CCMP622" /LENGTH=34 /DNA_ID= /DNA_START= /DNA_END= /DNA_ORIENTATION=
MDDEKSEVEGLAQAKKCVGLAASPFRMLQIGLVL